MRPSFFIFSLPRSGSSWLSVFLTGKHSFCYHEPTADYKPDEWGEVISHRPESYVGAVDTGAYIFADEIWATFPKTKFFSLCRDPYDISRSARHQGFEYDAHHEREKLDSLRHERILYSKLNDINYLEELWERVVGSIFDPERAKLLIEMRIERDIAKFYNTRPTMACYTEIVH